MNYKDKLRHVSYRKFMIVQKYRISLQSFDLLLILIFSSSDCQNSNPSRDQQTQFETFSPDKTEQSHSFNQHDVFPLSYNQRRLYKGQLQVFHFTVE